MNVIWRILFQTDLLTVNLKTGYKFRGHFLDLRTLAFALTDEGYTLESACDAFGVEHGKQSRRAPWHNHGRIHRLQSSRRCGDGGISD